MQAKLKALNAPRKPQRKNRPTRWSDEEWEVIKAKANELAGGNVSAFLRYVGLNYVPKKSELEK